MMKKKYIGAALACALAMGAWSGAALATPMTVGGVTWDPSSGFDLKIQGIDLRETTVANNGDTLTGYGLISSINSTNQATFCVGCDLTFTFTYKVLDITGPQIVFGDGIVNFYVGPQNGFSEADPASANPGGTPWLTLTGHTLAFPGFPAIGQLYSTVVGPASAPLAGSGGQGYLDATGGIAAPYMNTNTEAGGSDFFFTSSFASDPFNPCPGAPNNICNYPIAGTATLAGKSMIPVKVPEPGPVGLLGIGLAVLGLFMRRRRNESEGRA